MRQERRPQVHKEAPPTPLVLRLENYWSQNESLFGEGKIKMDNLRSSDTDYANEKLKTKSPAHIPKQKEVFQRVSLTYRWVLNARIQPFKFRKILENETKPAMVAYAYSA